MKYISESFAFPRAETVPQGKKHLFTEPFLGIREKKETKNMSLTVFLNYAVTLF